jgi:MFS family permease
MKGKLTVLMITAFVDMLGLAMIIPLLPFYATKLGASATTVGVLIAAFSIAQLASAPLWGRFSDRYGRRPALLAGLLVSAVAYVIFAYASTLWLLLLSRVVQGFGGGTIGVVQAYVADASDPKRKASAGFLLRPALVPSSARRLDRRSSTGDGTRPELRRQSSAF